jgi:type IV pilus assembly protein PilC
MPKFKYTAKNLSGTTTTNETESFSKESLIQNLQNQGLFIVKIDEIKPSLEKKPSQPVRPQSTTAKKFHHTKIKLSDIITFARQLVTMLESGVTLLRSLHVIMEQIDSKKLHDVVAQISKRVEQGSTLADAMSEHPKVFNQFWISLVEVGETAGTLPQVLNKLSFYLEQQASFQSTIVSAIIYPAVLFCVCMGAISFFALFVGPRFEEIFTSMNVQLPIITKILLKSFRILKQHFLKIVFGFIILIFLFRKYIKTKSGQKNLENFLFSLPTVGNIYRLIIVERFTSQMAILIDSGVPILQALDISSRLVDNATCSKVILEIKEKVRQGELLASPMYESGFFPGMATQMITVGEETGELSKMLKHVAEFYQSTVETFMKRIGTVIEPFMLIFMGGVIGIIVVAMFMPMFNLAQLGGGM